MTSGILAFGETLSMYALAHSAFTGTHDSPAIGWKHCYVWSSKVSLMLLFGHLHLVQWTSGADLFDHWVLPSLFYPRIGRPAVLVPRHHGSPLILFSCRPGQSQRFNGTIYQVCFSSHCG